MTRERIRVKILGLFLFLSSFLIFAENLTDYDYKFSIDIPEGYAIESYSEDGTSYSFKHQYLPVTLWLKISNQENTSAQKLLKTNMEILKAKAEINTFNWNENLCALANFIFTQDKKNSGWAICTNLQEENKYISLICFCDSDKEQYCQQFIMSTLNSLCVNFDYYNTPGPIVSFAYPQEGDKEISLNINNTNITTKINQSDEEAAQFLIDLEYGVLCLYVKSDMKIQAWQRYYRMIYRDSFGRLQQVSQDIYKTLYPLAHNKNKEEAPIIFAQNILTWVQNFEYIRGTKKTDSDFSSLPSILTGSGSDCDSRSLLVSVILKYIGFETIMLVSPEYSHAMVATEIEAPGQIYTLEGTDRNFLYGETTAKVTWGKIFKDYSDSSKFFPVIFP